MSALATAAILAQHEIEPVLQFTTRDRNRIALSFITGGAIGNVLDRINDGSVTDFLHLKIYNYSLFIFNLADAFITIGAILIIYFEFKNYLK